MKRDLDQLVGREWDLLVVGGGIHGATVAAKAARRGFATALVEQGDFGGGTSANSLKILHGGLRYLQHLDFPRMRQSIRSRREIAARFPHLVRPLPCVIGTRGIGLKSWLAMATALRVNDWVSMDRNRGLEPEVFLPGGRMLTRDEMRAWLPEEVRARASGAAMWHDYLCLDTERLVLEYLLEASRYGAGVANHVSVESLGEVRSGSREVSLRDRIGGAEIHVRARQVVLAMGPWCAEKLLATGKDRTVCPGLAKGINLVINRSLTGDIALGVEGSLGDGHGGQAKRFFFLVPWEGRTMIGTTYQLADGAAASLEVSGEEISTIVDGVNSLVPSFGLKREEVSTTHAGLLPLSGDRGSSRGDAASRLQRHSQVTRRRAEGLITIGSVKFTTAPCIADQVMRLLAGGKGFVPQLRGQERQELDSRPEAAEADWVKRILARYGSQSSVLMNAIREEPSLGELVGAGEPVLIAEVRHAIREEMAFSLEDLVFRRLGVGSSRKPSAEWLRRLADVASSELGWDDAEMGRELDAVDLAFGRLLPEAMGRSES